MMPITIAMMMMLMMTMTMMMMMMMDGALITIVGFPLPPPNPPYHTKCGLIGIYIHDRWRVGPPPCLHCSFVVGVLLLVLSNCNSSDKGQLPVPMPLCLLLLVSGPLTLTT